MKKFTLFLMLIVLLSNYLNSYSQETPSFVKLQLYPVAMSGKDARYPLKGKEYYYEAVLSGNEKNANIYLTCINGTVNGASATTIAAGTNGSYRFVVKWSSKAASGSITSNVGGVSSVLNYNLATPSINISGPGSINFNEQGSFTVTANNPNVKISDISVSLDSRFKFVGSSKDNPIRIIPAINELVDVSNAIKVTANTSEGTLTASKAIRVNPYMRLVASNNLVCSMNEQYYYELSHLPTGATVNWTVNNLVSIVSGQGTKKLVVKAQGTGQPVIKADIRSSNGNISLTNSDVWVGKPLLLGIYEIDRHPDNYFKPNNLHRLTPIFEKYEAEEYLWKLSGDASIFGGNNYSTLAIEPYIPHPNSNYGTFQVELTAKNKCGSVHLTRIGVVSDPSKGDDKEIDQPPVLMMLQEPAASIRVLSFTTGEVLYKEKDAVNFNIQNTNLKAGIYIVESTDAAGEVTRTKVMKTK